MKELKTTRIDPSLPEMNVRVGGAYFTRNGLWVKIQECHSFRGAFRKPEEYAYFAPIGDINYYWKRSGDSVGANGGRHMDFVSEGQSNQDPPTFMPNPSVGVIDAQPGVPSILVEIVAERARQDAKYGEQNHDPFTWLSIVGVELGMVNQGARWLRKWPSGQAVPRGGFYRRQLIRIAAVSIAMIECMDRQKWRWPSQLIEYHELPPPAPETIQTVATLEALVKGLDVGRNAPSRVCPAGTPECAGTITTVRASATGMFNACGFCGVSVQSTP